MALQHDLHELVQSLTSSEKRYFTLQAKKTGKSESNYMKLFHALNALEEYDEERLKRKLKGEKFVDRLPVEVAYLYNTLLRAIRLFQNENSELEKMKDWLKYAMILRDRFLFEQASRALQKAKKIALTFENQVALLEINRVERTILTYVKKESLVEELGNLIQEKEGYLTKLIEEKTWLDYAGRFSVLFTKQIKPEDRRLNQEDKDQFQHYINTIETADFTFGGQHNFLQAKAFYDLLLDDVGSALRSYEEILEWWESHTSLRREWFFHYRKDVINYINMCFLNNQFEKGFEMIDKLEVRAKKTPAEESLLFDLNANFRFLFLMNQGAFEEARAMVAMIEGEIDKHPMRSSRRFNILFNLASFYFLTEDFRLAAVWYQKLNKKGNARKDLLKATRFLLAICLFEQGDTDGLEKHFRSSIRFFKKDPDLDSRELGLDVIQYLSKIASCSITELPERFKNLKDYLKTTKSKPGYVFVPGLDEIHFWVFSRWSKKTIPETFKLLNT